MKAEIDVGACGYAPDARRSQAGIAAVERVEHAHLARRGREIDQFGDERVEAQIQRIEKAKATFQKAKQEGKAAALLTQHRPNMFTQDIANLMPKLPVQVTLTYSQILTKVDGQYELVLPLVVGPRLST